MTTAERDFIALIKYEAGLCGECVLSKNPDWHAIYHLAYEHTVLGILAEAVNDERIKYSETQIGNDSFRDVKKQLFDDSLEIIRRNKRVNELQAKVVTLLRENNIECIVQKGQGVAQSYPNPMTRMSGDIDLLLTKEDYQKAKELLLPRSTAAENEMPEDSHLEMMFGDLSVELHASEFYYLNSETRDNYNNLLKNVFSEEGRKQWRSYECEGVKINLAPADFDVFYIFLHMVKHYYVNGLGMRQLIDFFLIYQKTNDEDKSKMRHWAETFGVQREWEQFCNIWERELLLSIILKQGNMGRGRKPFVFKNNVQKAMWLFKRNYSNTLRHLPFSKSRFAKRLLEANATTARAAWQHKVLNRKQ